MQSERKFSKLKVGELVRCTANHGHLGELGLVTGHEGPNCSKHPEPTSPGGYIWVLVAGQEKLIEDEDLERVNAK